MKKIGEIADILTTKHGLSAEEAAHFVQTMFDVASENLIDDEAQVKIKDLGTFKVAAVSARESVDVNTGERITIGGRNKISFLPEPSLRDRVNQPFAQFKSVPLNEGVDFSAIDAEMAEGAGKQSPTKKGDDSATPATKVPTQDETTATEQQTTENTDKKSDNEADNEAPAVADIPPTDEQTSDVDGEEKASNDDENAVDKTTDDTEKTDDDEEKASNDSPNGGSNDHGGDDDEAEESDGGGGGGGGGGKTRLLTVALIALLLVIIAGAWYFHNQMSQRDEQIALLEERLNALDSVNNAATNDSIATAEAQQSHDNVADTTAEKAAEMDPTQYNSDARVRTGAYIITGIAYTVTAQPGQTLKSISKAQLGPGMECYVEAVNGKKEFAVGEEVKIPKLKMKKGVMKKSK